MPAPLRKAAFCVAALLVSAPSLAQLQPYHPPRTVYGVVTAGFTAGGDELASVDYGHGDEEDVDAGGQILFGGGVIIEPPDGIIQYQFTANYHVDGAFASNGEAEFERYPMEALMFFVQGRHRFGFGLTYHLQPEFDIDIDGVGSTTVNFDDALGVAAEYNFEITRRFWLGLRYTDIEYEVEDDSSTSVDGNHWGLMLHFQL